MFGEVWIWDGPRVTLDDFGFDNGDPGYDPNLSSRSGLTLTANVGASADLRNLTANPVDIGKFLTIMSTTTSCEIQLGNALNNRLVGNLGANRLNGLKAVTRCRAAALPTSMSPMATTP